MLSTEKFVAGFDSIIYNDLKSTAKPDMHSDTGVTVAVVLPNRILALDSALLLVNITLLLGNIMHVRPLIGQLFPHTFSFMENSFRQNKIAGIVYFT